MEAVLTSGNIGASGHVGRAATVSWSAYGVGTSWDRLKHPGEGVYPHGRPGGLRRYRSPLARQGQPGDRAERHVPAQRGRLYLSPPRLRGRGAFGPRVSLLCGVAEKATPVAGKDTAANSPALLARGAGCGGLEPGVRYHSGPPYRQPGYRHCAASQVSTAPVHPVGLPPGVSGAADYRAPGDAPAPSPPAFGGKHFPGPANPDCQPAQRAFRWSDPRRDGSSPGGADSAGGTGETGCGGNAAGSGDPRLTATLCGWPAPVAESA